MLTQSKKPTPPKAVEVRLSCTYSGNGQSWPAGVLVSVDTEEHDRLISLGVVIGAEPKA